MSSQKWYNKATVQAAIVAALPSMITAIIAIIAIYYTWSAANRQLDFDRKQSKRDSINSVLQFQLLQRQLELTNKTFYNDSIINAQQLQIAQENLSLLLTDSRTKATASWGKLRNTMWGIMEMTSTKGRKGYLGLDELTIEEKTKRVNKIWELLNSEIDNPTLIKDKKCLGYWRSAISKAKMLKDGNLNSYKKYSDQISSLMSDVFFVWTDLVLNSSEVSASGGKPN